MPLHIVNVGSSFAAGPGISPQIDTDAGRSGKNYAHLVARQLGAKLTDLTVSGATLLNLLSEPQQAGNKTFPPQISQIPVDADIVLVLGGGNDIGYIGGLFVDSFNAYWIYRVYSRISSWISGEPAAELPSMSTQALADRYGTVLDAVHLKVPKARVVVVEYVSLLGPDLRPGTDVPFDASLLPKHKAKAEQVRVATIQAIRGREAWCERVLVTGASVDHGLGSQQPWVSGWGLKELYLMGAYHPNAQGMIAVAERVATMLIDLKLTQ